MAYKGKKNYKVLKEEMNQVSKVYFCLFLLIVLMITIIMSDEVGFSDVVSSDLHMQCTCLHK